MNAPKTNGDFLADLYRQELALRSPKSHIPLGIAGFMLLSAVSAAPLVPWIWAGLVGYDANRRLRKNRKLLEKSYRDPRVLFDNIGQDEKELVSEFLNQYPIYEPFGTKKVPPPRQQKTQPQMSSTKSEGEVSSPKPQANPKAETETVPVESGWQPTDLPQAFVPYLASQIHLLIAATTGSGKTWLLRALCSHLANRGDLLCIADPKGTQWGELGPAVKRMRSGTDYSALIQDLHRELEARIERLQSGQPVGPHLWAVFDEWFLAKGKCGMLDPDGRKAIEIRLLDIIAAGRELNVHLIIVGQSHFLGDLSLSGGKNTFSSGLRDNLCTLGLGCKATKDNSGSMMAGNSKSIDSMLNDQALLRDAADRSAAQTFHAELRRQPGVNRTYCLYSSQLFIGQTPDLTIPDLIKLNPFPKEPTP